ncbi:excinuclease ABC subunit C [Halorubellus sp. JP-L1]|uniref:excinuclease ABC subunit C n=1 Tax=Halorubellus sp. JP-L1 TaxID=2715753 RepID=UPI0014082835|nr:excinuclease ABC subunit C [Halorubellus sp. JP-L1]NHN43524.1 excinuclease ABC subunit C [Halorubellus sp. JP-L1]
MDSTAVRERAMNVPAEPGVYQFFEGDVVLYVGKAVDLRSRVRSYADPRSARIRRMVERADALEVAETDTETQALLLEANLIKRHQPRYNVRLKDDKSYPLVQLTSHEFPRIEVTRDPAEDATVFGPFTNKGDVETVVKALRETFGVRGCSDHKFAGRERPCLDYEVGLCTAPCTGEIGEADYLGDVESVERFFAGETGVLADPLRSEMTAASAGQQFERAANLRDRLAVVESFHGEGGEAVSATGDDYERHVDVLGVAVDGDRATVARLHAEGGQLVERDRHRIDVPSDAEGVDGTVEEEPVPAVLSAFLVQYYAERDLPDAVLLPEAHGDEEVAAWLDAAGVAVRVPGAGREAKLVDLALKNARTGTGSRDATRELAHALGLEDAARIEGFDVSHAQGKAVVGSNVTFVDGSARKPDYRRKKLADENDDYARMRELVGWRAERAVEGRDDRPDPDLLLIDGGRGQLDAALEAVESAGWDVPVVALAKREETVVAPDGEYDWDGDGKLQVLRRVRDEAHRFAVQYHQSVRDDVSTVLDDVPGVGPATRKRLLGRFGSVENVRAATVDELEGVDGVGEKTARAIADRL